jgi:hypothetical protein
MFVRRFALVLSIVFCGSLAMAAAAIAAGGMGPGKYTFHSTSADAFFGMGKKGGPPSASWSVSVNQGLNSFKSKSGGPVVIDDTVVFLTEFDANGQGGYGCFVIPDGDFTVSHGLESATLSTTLTTDEACGGYGSPVGGGKDAVYAGGNSGLVLPISISVSWTASGAITTYKDSFSVRCLDYSQDASSTVRSTAAGASGTISALTGNFGAEISSVSDSSGQFDIHNQPQAACLGY